MTAQELMTVKEGSGKKSDITRCREWSMFLKMCKQTNTNGEFWHS